MPEQGARNVLLARPLEKRISHAQFENPLRGPPFARHHRGGQAALTGEHDKFLESIELRLGRFQSRHAMLDEGGPAEQGAVVQVEANGPTTVTEEPVFISRRANFDRHKDIILRPWQTGAR